MNIPPIKYTKTLGAALSLAVPGLLGAATITWDGEIDSDFENASNWVGDVLPADDTTTDIAQLIGGTVDLTATRSVAGLDLITAPTTLTGTGTTLTTVGLTGSQTLTLAPSTTLDLDGTDSALNFTGDITVGLGSVLFPEINAIRLDTETHGTTTITLDGGKIEADGNHLDMTGRNIVLTANGGTLHHKHARNIYGINSSVISGTGDLTLLGQNTTAGRIQLQNAVNTYVGTTKIIEGAQAWISVDTALGDAANPVEFDSGGTWYSSGSGFTSPRAISILAGGARVDHQNDTITWSGIVSGAGPLTVTTANGNPGGLALTNSGNTLSGDISVTNNGILKSGDANTFGTGVINLDGGMLSGNGGHLNMTNLASQSIVLGSEGGAFRNSHARAFYGMDAIVVSGDGQLTLDGINSTNANSRIQMGNSVNTYTGGTLITNKANAQIAQDTNLGAADTKVTIDDARFVSSNNTTFGAREFEIASGGGTLSLNNKTVTMNGPLTGSGPLTIDGGSRNYGTASVGGTLRMFSPGTYTGDLSVDVVGLELGANNALGTGTVTLNNSAQLKNRDSYTTLNNEVAIDDIVGAELMAGWSKSLTLSGVVSGLYNDLDPDHALTIVGDSGWVILDNPANSLGARIALPDATSKLRVASLGNGTVSGDYDGETTGAGEIDFDIGTGTQAISYGLKHTGATTISSGTVSLKYDGQWVTDVSLLNDSGALKLGGGTLDLLNGTHAEVVGSTTLLAGTASAITQTGGTATIEMGAITQEPGASIDFGASNIATTTNTNTNGILGSWATIAGTDFAANDGSGNIVAFTGYSDVTRLDGGTQVIADAASSQVRIIEGTGSAADITLGAALTTIDTLNQSTDGGSSPATIDLSAGTLAVNSILTGSGAGDLTLNNGTLQSVGTELLIANNANMTVNSVITDGTGGDSDLSKSGSGTLTLTADATGSYNGVTNVNEGTLVMTNDTHSSGFNVASGATLEINWAGRFGEDSGPAFTGLGTIVKTGAGNLDFLSANFGMGAGSLIDIQAGSFTAGSGENEVWTANLSDLNVASGALFNTAEGNVYVDKVTGNGTISTGFDGAGYERLRIGVNHGSATFDGIIEDNSYAGNLEKQGTGTQTFTGANTYTGFTLVSAGTLEITNALGLQNSAIDTSGAGQIALTGPTSPTIGGLTGSTDIASVITTGYASVTALTLNPAAGANISYSGAITDGTAPMGLIKTGTGTQTLSGNNTYTGATTVNEGILIFEGNFPSVDFAANAGGTLDIDTTAADKQINGGTISGDGTIVKSGSGLLMLGANGSAQSVSMTGGLIDVQEGTLRNEYSNGDWSANLASLHVALGATVDTWDSPGGIRVDALTGAGTVTHTSYGAPSNLTVGVNDGSGTFTGVITDDVSRVLGLVKEGVGTQTLTGNHTYTGATTVSAGTLELADGSLTSAITVADGASLGFVAGAPITSTGTVDLVAGSTISISGTPTLSSYTLITASAITGTAVLNSPIAGYELNQTATTLTLVSTTAGDFDSWATENGIAGELPGDDFEDDGLSNLLEYALGKDPTVSDGPAETSYDGMTVVYTKGADAIANGDVRWAIEESDDLGETDPWEEVVIQSPGDATATISHTLPSKGKVFVRLRVTQVVAP